MKRILTTSSVVPALLIASVQHAFADVPVNIVAPDKSVLPSNTGIGQVVSVLIAFLVVVAVLAALLYIVLGAIQWITSGGDKTKVEAARNHIIAAIVGLVIIALSFVILNIVTNLLGIGNITSLNIKSVIPGQP